MPELQTVHTAELEPGRVRSIRGLLDEAFAPDGVTDHDLEHALGGIHALVWDGPELIAHGSVVMRRMLHQGRALRTGYVEAVAVRPDHQRQGHGSALMAALEDVIRGAYVLGALSASDAGAPLYESRGWERWAGTTSVLAPEGTRRTPGDDGSVFVLPVTAQLDVSGDLACDWREGDVW